MTVDFLQITHHRVAVLHRTLSHRRIGFTAERPSLDEKLQCVLDALRRRGFDVTVYERGNKPDLDNVDFLLAVGGDGTVLEAAQSTKTVPMCGINIAPDTSLGHHCSATIDNFGILLDKICAGQAKVTAVPRMEIVLNDEPLPTPVLNDCLFACNCPALTNKYKLTFNGLTENQYSSGIWISTAAGSTGGIASAGAKPIPLTDERLLFLVREPCLNSVIQFSILAGEIRPDDQFSIQCMTTDMRLFCDGTLQIHELRENDILSFRRHSMPWMKIIP